MASEDLRAESPPLPPDPSPVAPKLRTSQELPATPQQPSPRTPLREQPQPDLKRVDSSRTPQRQAPISPILQQRQPIKDAVNDAFQDTPVTNQIDPELIRQVTEQVIKNLQAAAPTPTPSAQTQQTQYPPPPPPQSQEPRSPTQSSVDSNNERYTPPTPERNREGRDYEAESSSSPEPPASDTGSNLSRESRGSVRSRESQRSVDTPKPFKSDSSSRARRTSYTTRRRSGTIPKEDSLRREWSGSDSTAREKTPFRRDSKDSEASYDGTSTRSRMRPPRVPSDVEETPLEKFWQPLFDNGNPTVRLSQFLRGLALHLIDDYEPRYSLVVTPAKMLRFLNETKINEEHYPWETIFGGNLTPVSISMMYQKLLCQHHLIQERYDRAPTIPGLTPNGFDYFMTCLIQAHPDTEYERLVKAVMNMPISNADNKTERFPKELPRRLLPAEANIQAEQRLVSSLNHEPYVVGNLKGSLSMPPPPPSAPPGTMNNERERKPYSQSSSMSNAVDDDDLSGPPPVQIERERKPYTGREGAGKTYGGSDEARPTPIPTQYKPEIPGGSSRPSRTNSGVPPQAMYANSSGPSDPMNIPPRHPHRMSTGQGAPPPMANGGASRTGRRSPTSMRNPYARSEPDFAASMPNSQYASNLHPTNSREQYPVDPDDELRRYRSRSRADRSNGNNNNNPVEDDTNGGRGYPIPGRGVPISSGYEYGTGGPPGGDPRGGIPVGSYPSRRPMGASSTEERRRSTYVAPTQGMMGGDGGTDGWGSFAAGATNGGSGYPPQQSYGSSVQH